MKPLQVVVLVLLSFVVSNGQISQPATKVKTSTFANLGTPADGSVRYCSNCQATSPCTGSGTGAVASRVNGAWNCGTGGVGTGTVTNTGTLTSGKAIIGNGTTDEKASKVTLTDPATTATFTLADNKTFTVNKTLTLDGIDGTTMTFPGSSATIARIDASNTFLGTQVFSGGMQMANSNTFVFLTGSEIQQYDAGGTNRTFIMGANTSNNPQWSSGIYLGWRSSASEAFGAPDVTISRNGVGVLQVGTTTNNSSGDLTLHNLTSSNQITSTVATGTAPLVVASTTQVSNLNASQLVGATWVAPSTIGSTTPNTGAFTSLNAGSAKFTVDTNGLPTKSNNLTLAGQGYGAILGVTSQKAETTSADANVLTVTPASAVGTYRVCTAISVASATSGVISWTLSWTDSSGNAQSNIAQQIFQMGTAAPNTTFTTSAAGNYYGCSMIDTNNAGANIIVKWVGGGTSSAKMTASVERIN